MYDSHIRGMIELRVGSISLFNSILLLLLPAGSSSGRGDIHDVIKTIKNGINRQTNKHHNVNHNDNEILVYNMIPSILSYPPNQPPKQQQQRNKIKTNA